MKVYTKRGGNSAATSFCVTFHEFYSVCLSKVMRPTGLKDMRYMYCKFGNFRENIIFANSVKRHICDVKNLRLRHDLPISVNDTDFAISRGFYFTKYAKFREYKTLAKIRIYSIIELYVCSYSTVTVHV